MDVFSGRWASPTGWSAPLPAWDGPATLVLVLGPSGLRHEPGHPALADLRAVFPTSPLAGCSTSGEVSGSELHDDTLTVAVLRFAATRVHVETAPVTAACDALAVRLRLAAHLAPELGLGPQDAAADHVRTAVDAALGAWLQEGASLRALDPEALLAAARAALPPACTRALREWAPDHVMLPHGKRLAITYGEGAPPYVQSYLQDFFGAATGPTVAGGRLPLVVHLWGPNRRALQVTKDLAGFWREHYPKLRPALARRYPRHAWPDEPATARPSGRLRRPQ